MPIARNLAASGGRSSNPREKANQYQGPPSGIAVHCEDSGAFSPFCFSNSFQEHSTRTQWKSQVLSMAWRCLAEGLPRESEKKIITENNLSS